jgi:hypothetical protein
VLTGYTSSISISRLVAEDDIPAIKNVKNYDKEFDTFADENDAAIIETEQHQDVEIFKHLHL